ncbi:MAG: hypothetical protein JRJ24_21125, partial [Deltaproteobacteria bacterium]|nr:hypothetical protein [Deltaproteobacteria bacterium]
DGNANDLDECNTACEVEDIILADAGVPDPPDASIPDASIPDASIPDAGEPDATVDEDTPLDFADSPGNPSTPDPLLSDEELPTAASSESPGGCTVRGTRTDTMWPILLALLLTARRRFVS